MALLNNTRIKASTLIEVIVSMTIVLLTFATALTVMIKVFSGGLNGTRLKTWLEMTSFHAKTIHDQVYVSQKKERIKTEILPYKASNLLLVNTLMDGDTSAAEISIKQLVIK